MHWTAGGNTANATDIKHYARIINGDGKIVFGNHPISVNAHPIKNPRDASTYYAHTGRFNTDNIGVAVAGMRRAKERPFDPGPSPINEVQIEVLVDQVASLCRQYKIPVTRETVLTHAEVETTHGVKQNGKWDIKWLPGFAATRDPIFVGDILRDRIRAKVAGRPYPEDAPQVVPRKPDPLARLVTWIFSKIFGNNKGGPA